jgi:two-component system sensor histidine kinase KdpD
VGRARPARRRGGAGPCAGGDARGPLTSTRRPDPEALLRRIAKDAPRTRGRLKVFFGASPGVGKTYAMLESARARRAEGTDVVIGWVETHGRAETAALAEGLERIPPREVEYKAVRLPEFDLDAALARKPQLLLLDELAHTNAPGSRHAKRWQDVEELLEAGIDVHTTLNVQHVESLGDLVHRVTGVVVRETVPDRVLDGADEVEFVDLPPEALLKRLAEGKVYVPDRAAQAVRSFFRRGNLLALRELALRRTAEHVDADIQDYRRDHEIESTWPVSERILVCVRPNPESDRLVRAARRMAARLKAEWIVAWVDGPAQRAPTPAERQALAGTVKLAESLGAQTVSLAGDDVAQALLDFARRRNVSRIVVGKPLHSRWRDRLRGSVVDDIVRGSGGIEVMVIPGGVKTAGAPPAAPARKPRLRGYAVSLVVVLACTAVCAAMFGRFDNSNLVMIYLLGVAFVATRYGRRPSALAAVLSVAAFDFFFVPPYLTFAVSDTQYVVTFAVMLVVGLLISTLAARVRGHGQAAARRAERTQILYAMSRDVAAAKTVDEVAAAAKRHVGQLLEGPAEIFLPAADGRLTTAEEGPEIAGAEQAVAQWTFDHRKSAGLGTDTLPGAQAVYFPLTGSQSVLGVVGVRPRPALLPLDPDQLDLVEALARQAGSGLERVRLAREIETERVRATLLSAVSHDLRTPLAAITGAASSLLQPVSLDPAAERGLKETIYEEAERLGRLVHNLLDMTRLESGAVALGVDWHPLEEIVGAALARVEGRRRGRPIEVAIPADLPLVRVDAVLLEQVLVNLLDNALTHGEAATPIRVSASSSGREVAVEVADDGPGLPPGEEERAFEKFYRGGARPRGFGLGLPICRAIVGAHGGRIWAQNLSPRGVSFRFTLPVGDGPPPVVEAAGDGQRA